MTLLVWYLDRAAGLVAYPTLYLAALTGVLFNARQFPTARAVARGVHYELAALAVVTMVIHGAVGLLDTWYVVDGQAPAPPFGVPYLVAGVAVGIGALFVLVVAVLGFVDPRRFERPWSPQVVHAFAYLGFGFATVHVAAVGTDVVGLVRPLVVPSVGFLALVLALRALTWGRGAAARS